MFDVVAVAAGRNSTVIKDEKSKDVGSWLRDKAKAVEHLAADMTVPEQSARWRLWPKSTAAWPNEGRPDQRGKSHKADSYPKWKG